jgi:hypothetical protein
MLARPDRRQHRIQMRTAGRGDQNRIHIRTPDKRLHRVLGLSPCQIRQLAGSRRISPGDRHETRILQSGQCINMNTGDTPAPYNSKSDLIFHKICVSLSEGNAFSAQGLQDF